MRAYYISVPLVFALFNPYYIVIASVALIMALYHIDRAPDTQPYVSDIERKRLNESQLKLKITASEDRRKISGF